MNQSETNNLDPKANKRLKELTENTNKGRQRKK